MTQSNHSPAPCRPTALSRPSPHAPPPATRASLPARALPARHRCPPSRPRVHPHPSPLHPSLRLSMVRRSRLCARLRPCRGPPRGLALPEQAASAVTAGTHPLKPPPRQAEPCPARPTRRGRVPSCPERRGTSGALAGDGRVRREHALTYRCGRAPAPTCGGAHRLPGQDGGPAGPEEVARHHVLPPRRRRLAPRVAAGGVRASEPRGGGVGEQEPPLPPPHLSAARADRPSHADVTRTPSESRRPHLRR
jgi:hypothetical protein